MERPVNLLVVGLGRQGLRHVRVAATTGACRVVATVDPNAAPVNGIPHFAELDAALDACPDKIDAAIVASSVHSHFDLAVTLLDQGIPILVEKPMVASPAKGVLLVDRAKATGTLLAVGHVERFNPCVQLVKALLRDGSVGRPVACSFRRVGLAPPSQPEIDVIHDLAVHDIDIFGFLTGSAPTFVGSSGWVGGNDLVESAHILVVAGAVHGLVEVNWRTPVRLRSFAVTTDTCLVQADYTTQVVEIVQASTELDLEEFSAFRSHYGAARRTQMEARVAEPLAEQMIAFAAAVRGEPSPDLARGIDGLHAVDVAARATEAARDYAARTGEQ